MEIKTKYNIGDKVRAMTKNGDWEYFIVSDIKIHITQSKSIIIWYIDENDIGYREPHVFTQKEKNY